MPISDDAAPPEHGGDLAAFRAAFPYAPPPVLDLSTGINPDGYPLPALSAASWARLPDRDDLARLEHTAAACYGAPPAAQVVAAPGAQALIQLLPRLFRPRAIGILGFTYGEYERVWRAAGVVPQTVEDPAELAAFDLAIVVNPNNPDGRLVPPERLAVIAAALARRGGTLVVDEAFADFVPGASLAPSLLAATLVLRSFGKAYGLAGVRLGFAIAAPPLAAAIRAALGPWAVSGPAIAIGQAALADRAWLAAGGARLAARGAELDRILAAAGFDLIGGTPLFRLAAHRDAARIWRRLGEHGLLVRRFPARPDWLRLAIPGDDAAADRLAAALAAG